MANVYATKSGDWSDTTVWNTGVLPTSADDVYTNNFNVNVNQNITVNSLRNLSNTSITSGGTFMFNTGGVTALINDSIFFADATTIINVSASSGLVTINCPNAVITNPNTGSANIIIHSGNCDFTFTAVSIIQNNHAYNHRIFLTKSSNLNTLTVNANLYGSNTGIAISNFVIYASMVSGTIIVNGNVYGGNTNQSTPTIFINQGSCNLKVNGNVIGGSGTLNYTGVVYSTGTGTVNIIGNVTGGATNGASVTAGTLNIIGIITGGTVNGVAGALVTGTGTLNHTGAAKASVYASAIRCDSPTTSTVTCTGPFLKNGYIVAIASQTLRINFNSNSYFQFKKSNGDDIDYVSTIEGYNYPLASDVRYGVEYKSGLAIGTCHVPTPDNVRKNIPVDNTVGTADNITADDILQAIQDSSLPIAERLRNVATVESTGAQLEAYQ